MGVEDFPLTCAGMFAQQITPQTPRYAFQLTGDDGLGGQPRLVPFRDIGASKRSFFVHAYGSASPNTCHTYFYNDTPEAFSARMSDWLTGFMNTWKRKHADQEAPQRLTLWLEQIYPERGEPIPVLHYRAKDKAVELKPKVQWPAGLVEENEKAED